jgi:hypothetical protein
MYYLAITPAEPAGIHGFTGFVKHDIRAAANGLHVDPKI